MNLRPVARRGAQARPQPTAATPVVQAAPPVPMTMAQMPSVPPQVSYQNGMLTIVAQNSSLGDILRAVHHSTGAAIDVPPNATERVVAQIGPGPARDVLASLLNGSTFNYVMLGSATDPSSLASVMLTMKTGAPGETMANNVYQPPQQQYMVNQPVMPPGQGPGGPVVQPPANDEEADADDKDDAEEDNADEEQAPNQENVVPALQQQDPNQPNAGPKTPEQILEMLRQRPGQVPPGQPVPPQSQPQSSDDNN